MASAAAIVNKIAAAGIIIIIIPAAEAAGLIIAAIPIGIIAAAIIAAAHAYAAITIAVVIGATAQSERARQPYCGQ
jgi:hypothetical protein